MIFFRSGVEAGFGVVFAGGGVAAGRVDGVFVVAGRVVVPVCCCCGVDSVSGRG